MLFPMKLPRLPEFLQQHRILGGALVLAVTQFGASFAGLIRDNLLARTFPGLGVVDVYLASFRPSDLLLQVCVMSALGTVFIPMLAAHKAHGRREEMAQVLAGTMILGGLTFGALALLFVLVLPWVAPSLVGFQGPQLALYVNFARITLLTDLLFVFGNSFGQMLITEQRYWIYGLTPIVYSLGTIAGTLFLTPHFGVYGPMIGTVGGAILYVLWRAGAVFSIGFPWPKKFWHPDLKEMGVLMLPRMFALGALQLQLLLFDTIASGLGRGDVTINAYTRNFQAVIVGVAGIALAQSAFSLLGQTAAKKEVARFRSYVEKGTGMMLLLTIPSSLALILLAPVAARLVHLQSMEWYPMFRLCLIIYAISVPFESLAHLLLRAFYAMKDTAIPAILAFLSSIAAVAIAWYLAPQYGVLSLPIGYTAGQMAETVVLWVVLRRRMR